MKNKKTMKSKVMDFVRENGPQRFTDIQAFVYDTNYGEGAYKKGYQKEKIYNYGVAILFVVALSLMFS